VDPDGENPWCLFEKCLARDGHEDEGKRDEGGVEQLYDRCSFDVIENLYFRDHLLGGNLRAEPATDNRSIIGPVVTTFMFAGGRKLRLPRNLGPYSNDAECTAVPADTEGEGIRPLRSPEARMHEGLDEDVVEDAPETLEALEGPRKV
jgi:hypothetical protein